LKIAISLATGPAHKWGYQHVYAECLASQAEFADCIYLVQSTSDDTGIPEVLSRHSNIVFISNPSTWHHKLGETDEAMTTFPNMTEFHMRNLTIGRFAAFQDGYRVVLSSHTNWYIPRNNADNLRAYCERFYSTGQRTGKLWIVAQLADVLWGPGACGDFLCNLTDMDENGVWAYYPRLKFDRARAGTIPNNVENICVVDCPYELTPDEFGNNQLRWPEYRTLHWDAKDYITRRAERLNRIGFLQTTSLDYWGRLIAAKSRSDFLSHSILEAMNGA